MVSKVADASHAYSSMKFPPDTMLPVFQRLLDTWGPQAWWPSHSALETIVGAILVQNTAWSGVEMALARLRAEDVLCLDRLHQVEEAQLAEWIRPAGTFRTKAQRVRAFTRMVMTEYNGNLDALLAEPKARLRPILLSVSGIGPETADCILLYAAGQPAVVVDAYTRRCLDRHGWLPEAESYDKVSAWLAERLPHDAPVLNEFHALMVRLGKEHCRATPRCDGCPLQDLLPNNESPE